MPICTWFSSDPAAGCPAASAPHLSQVPVCCPAESAVPTEHPYSEYCSPFRAGPTALLLDSEEVLQDADAILKQLTGTLAASGASLPGLLAPSLKQPAGDQSAGPSNSAQTLTKEER